MCARACAHNMYIRTKTPLNIPRAAMIHSRQSRFMTQVKKGCVWWRHFARDVTRFQRDCRAITRHARRDEMRDDAIVGRKS